MGNCSSASATMSPSPPTRPLPAPMVPPTSTPLSHVASPRTPPNKMPTHGTTQHDYEMPTLPHKHSAVASERMPSQASTSSQRRSDDRDIPLPPSGSDPHSQEMPSYKFKSRGRVPPQLHKSISMDTPFPQGRPHSPSRMARTSSTTLLGQGPQPTGTQVESGLASGTGQIPADGQKRRPHFPSTLQSLLSNDFRCVVRCRADSHKLLTAAPSFTGSEFSLWARCVLCITLAVDESDDVLSQPGSGKSSLIKAIFNVDMPVCTRPSPRSFLTRLRACNL
jgi:hypothetical protein